MSANPRHPFDAALALDAHDDGSLHGQTSADYWNFVGPYGGITAATLLQGLLVDPRRLGDPVQLTVNFAAPVAAGAFRLIPRLLRANRNSQHWSIEMVQDDEHGEPQLVIAAMAMFANRRPTWSATDAVAPVLPPPDGVPQARLREGMAWPKMYAMRYPEWRFGQDNPDSYSHCWLRDATPRPLDFPALASMCDAFFPRVFLRRPQFVPIGTVSINIYFHADAATIAAHGEGFLIGAARGQIYHQGFFDQEARLWDERGRLLATTQQLVWFKE